MPYIHFTEDQKRRASEVDLVEFLRRQGEKLVRSGPEYRLTRDHSVTVRGNEWFDHAAERGGGPVSFLREFYNLSYPEAVTRLLGGEQGVVYAPASKQEEQPKKEFALPPARAFWQRRPPPVSVARQQKGIWRKAGWIWRCLAPRRR